MTLLFLENLKDKLEKSWILSFQKGGFNFSPVPSSIQLCITKINEIVQRKQPIIEIEGDEKNIAPEFSSIDR